MKPETLREIIETVIRLHPGVWRPGTVERIARACPSFDDGEHAIRWIKEALRTERLNADCYPLPFWPETYPAPFPTVPLADWI